MSDKEPDTSDAEQDLPSQDELQQRAQYVWGVLKFFFLGIFLIALVVIGIVGYWMFHAFGLAGLLILAILLAIGLVFLCRFLLTF
jgi:membrane protein YdbS with pleckstrin-like domain